MVETFDKEILNNLELFILPGKYLKVDEYTSIYNKTYSHWKKIWVEILDSKQNTKSDNFMRQDFLCSLMLNGEVVGLITCYFFNPNLIAVNDHSYLKPFPSDQYSAPDNKSYSMSIEYLSVSPNLRKSYMPISLGNVLLGISMKVFEESGAYSVLGTARNKLHVEKMCYEFGFKPIGKIEKFGLDCTLIVNLIDSLKKHPDFLTRKTIDSIWSKKVDLVRQININSNHGRITA